MVKYHCYIDESFCSVCMASLHLIPSVIEHISCFFFFSLKVYTFQISEAQRKTRKSLIVNGGSDLKKFEFSSTCPLFCVDGNVDGVKQGGQCITEVTKRVVEHKIQFPLLRSKARDTVL